MTLLAETAAIRLASAADIPALVDLAMRSKAHWGYDAAFLEACRDELTLTAKELAASAVAVLDNPKGRPVAMVQVVVKGTGAELHKMFVDPAHMGRGLGRKLMAWAVGHARERNARVMEIEADPNAAPFYARFGAVPAGSVPSGSIPGRKIPRLLLTL